MSTTRCLGQLALLCLAATALAAPKQPPAATSPDYRWAGSLEHDPLSNADVAIYTFTAERNADLQVNCTPNGKFLDAWVRLPERVYKRHFHHHQLQKLEVAVRLDDRLTTMAWYPQDDKRRLTLGRRDLEKLTSAGTAVIGFEAKGGKDDLIIFEFGHAPFACPTTPPGTMKPIVPPPPPPR